MDPREARLAPAPCDAGGRLEGALEIFLGHLVEAREDPSTRSRRQGEAPLGEPRIDLERIVGETDDGPRGARRHDLAHPCPRRELEDVVGRLAGFLALGRGDGGSARGGGHFHGGIDQAALPGASIAQRQERRRAQHRQRLGRLGRRAAEAQPAGQSRVEPCRSAGPVDVQLAADASRRAPDKLVGEHRSRRAGRRGQQGMRLLEADVGVDADAEAAQRRPCHTPQLGQQPGQGM